MAEIARTARPGAGTPGAPPDAQSSAVAAVERRPADIAVLVIGVVGAVLAGMWAQSRQSLDTSLFQVVNGLPDAFRGVADVVVFLGTPLFVAIVVVVLLVRRRGTVARDVASLRQAVDSALGGPTGSGSTS